MTANNFVRALKPFVQRRPFRPFAIEFVTGDRLIVKHPELIDLHGELIAHMDPRRNYRVFDAGGVCQLLDLPAD